MNTLKVYLYFILSYIAIPHAFDFRTRPFFPLLFYTTQTYRSFVEYYQYI
jgi:hypothetical protein